MKYYKVNKNGEVTIPAKIRKKYNIKPGTKICIEESGKNGIKLIPITEELIDRNVGVFNTNGKLLRKLKSEKDIEVR